MLLCSRWLTFLFVAAHTATTEATLAKAIRRRLETVMGQEPKSADFAHSRRKLELFSHGGKPGLSRCGCNIASSESEAVLEAREVGRIADEITRAKADLHGWQVKLEKAREHHNQHSKRLEKQLEIHKNSANRTGHNTHGSDRDWYARRMCALYVQTQLSPDGAAANLKIQELCMQRSSLAFLGFRRVSSLGIAVDKMSGCHCQLVPAATGPRIQTPQQAFLARSRHVAMSLTSPVDEITATLETIKAAAAKARARYLTETSLWRQERAELDATVAKHGNASSAAHQAGQKAKAEAWDSVRTLMCGMINGGADMETILKACPASSY
eukprot:TRINITY_DN33033_c0_g1_i1.p1 TRINITY_DN33033_c0_g1~~TRINITY_DN33033_c0_g1_i1.p1  ORF type:complete len:326 (+),score=40.28 TRINITY_DN33033_c0_g1_i1:56-1033(+)